MAGVIERPTGTVRSCGAFFQTATFIREGMYSSMSRASSASSLPTWYSQMPTTNWAAM